LSVRLPLDEPVLMGRSRCRHCDTPLKPRDLVPVLSWLALGGRCRFCDAPISLRYPLVEGAALLIMFWAWTVLSGPLLLITCLLGWSLLLLCLLDGEHFWLPLPLSLALLKSGLIVALFLPDAHWADHLIGAVAGFSFLWLLAFLYRRLRQRDGLGDGDPWLFGAAGAWVGWQGLSSVLFIASFSGIALAMALRWRGHGAGALLKLPFGPPLALGLWMVWLYGPLLL
jgi:leader peptidase (prepilin peptidase) / N-methyltransferase